MVHLFNELILTQQFKFPGFLLNFSRNPVGSGANLFNGFIYSCGCPAAQLDAFLTNLGAQPFARLGCK